MVIMLISKAVALLELWISECTGIAECGLTGAMIADCPSHESLDRAHLPDITSPSWTVESTLQAALMERKVN